MRVSQICEIFQSKERSRFLEAGQHLVRIAAGGLTIEEIGALAIAVAESGEKLNLPEDLSPFADVASTGGPGSLTTLLCPLLVASYGIGVPKLSAPGSIDGAIDTMSLIPGFKAQLSPEAFAAALRLAGIAHSEQTENFCPADKAVILIRRKVNMMANASLAAVSLIGKKLAIPRTRAVFDFRVGPTGNLGENAEKAIKGAVLFQRVAAKVGIPIAVTLTDNTSFPSSAVGRLESLHLVWQILNGEKLPVELDNAHLNACIEIAANACLLARPEVTLEDSKKRLCALLASGAVAHTFADHLVAQGAAVADMRSVMDQRAAQSLVIITSPGSGYWIPPALHEVKDWIKKAQSFVGGSADTTIDRDPQRQLGIRLLVSPGDKVTQGQPVMQVRCPAGSVIGFGFDVLKGWTSDRPPGVNRQIIQKIGG
ncbi:MAG: hypothetical protein HY695_13595 [Deltaproteobacteria bacterium]|nr:hypothetical protein [Deltaproteobacteria bacterium]